MIPEPLLTDSHIAELLRVSTRRVKQLVSDDGLPHVVLPGGEIRFVERDIAAWIDSQRQPFTECGK